MGFRIARVNEAAAGASQDFVETLDLGGTVIAALADGAGGIGGGAAAAQTAVRLALEAARRINPRDASAWSAVLVEIDAELEAHPDAGETTLVVAAVWDRGIAGASVGDSGALLIRDGVSDLTAGQHRRPLLGSGMAVSVPFAASGEGGVLLLASDGLLHYAPTEAIVKLVRDLEPEQAVRALVESVRLPSGALWDDTSVLMIRCG